MFCFLKHDVQRNAVVLGTAFLRGSHLQRVLDGRQRASQFVGRVGHKLLLAFDVASHLVEEAVDRQRHSIQLIVCAPHVQPIAQTRGLEALGRPQDSGDGAGGTQRQPVARQGREERDRKPHRNEDASQGIHVLIQKHRRHPNPYVKRLVCGIGESPSGKAVGAHLHKIFNFLMCHGPIGHFARAAIALPDRGAVAVEQLRKPAPLFVPHRLAAQFGNDGIGVGRKFLQGNRDLSNLAAEHRIGLAIERRSARHSDRGERNERGHQHHGGVQQREPHPQGSPRNSSNQSRGHSRGLESCG